MVAQTQKLITMAINQGITNSASFYNGKTKKFDIERCFEERANSLKNAKKELIWFLENPEANTEEYIKWYADKLADEFYTILKTAMDWEKKQFKKIPHNSL
jgi:CRISPR/Cas system CMR-associated protein Cmr5 small subunit